MTHAVNGICENLGVLQEFLGGGLKDCKIPLIIVEFRIRGLWEVDGAISTGTKENTRPCSLLDMPTFEVTMNGVLIGLVHVDSACPIDRRTAQMLYLYPSC